MIIVPSPVHKRAAAAPAPAPVAPPPAADIDATVEELLGRARDASDKRVEPITRIVQLFRIEDPKIRSRVALLVGRYISYTGFLQKRLEDEDARVRANVVESLWDADSELARTVLQAASKDNNHRVRGNALYGLYRLGDSSAPARLREFGAHASVCFRAAAAWVMGETRDPQFVNALETLSGDAEEGVRRNAALALTKIYHSALPPANARASCS